MEYQDKIYGKFKIEEPVILEIINSPVLQRLKEIDQGGYRPLWVKADFDIGEYGGTRFVHSLGVFLLLRKYKASLDEQIAGLIHDVSHTVFSHCVDYALEGGSQKEQNYQDNVFEKYVKKSELPNIFKKYGLDIVYFLDEKNFPLKEKSLPDLCADRIDYSLRDAITFEEINEERLNYFLDNLIVEDNDWVFKNFEAAKEYAELFSLLNTKYYAGFLAAIMLRVVGDYVKYALEKKYINEDDLYTTDKKIMSKINNNVSNDEKLKLLLDRMNNKISCKNSPGDYDAEVFCKSRVVDPLFFQDEKIQKISQADQTWAKILEQESKPKKYYLKFER